MLSAGNSLVFPGLRNYRHNSSNQEGT